MKRSPNTATCSATRFAVSTKHSGQRPDDQGKPDEAIAAYREAIRLKPEFAKPTPPSSSP